MECMYATLNVRIYSLLAAVAHHFLPAGTSCRNPQGYSLKKTLYRHAKLSFRCCCWWRVHLLSLLEFLFYFLSSRWFCRLDQLLSITWENWWSVPFLFFVIEVVVACQIVVFCFFFVIMVVLLFVFNPVVVDVSFVRELVLVIVGQNECSQWRCHFDRPVIFVDILRHCLWVLNKSVAVIIDVGTLAAGVGVHGGDVAGFAGTTHATVCADAPRGGRITRKRRLIAQRCAYKGSKPKKWGNTIISFTARHEMALAHRRMSRWPTSLGSCFRWHPWWPARLPPEMPACCQKCCWRSRWRFPGCLEMQIVKKMFLNPDARWGLFMSGENNSR